MNNNYLKTTFKRLSLRSAFIGCAVLACWIYPGPASAETEMVDRIVAIVNDDVISLYDLELAMKPYLQQITELGYSQEQERRMVFKLREDMLNQLINEKLTDQEVKKYKITVSDEEVDEFIENLKKTNFLTDEQLQAELAKEGMTLEDYRKRIKDRLLRTQLMTREVKSKIVITDEDIRDYYEAHRDQYAPESKYRLKHILLRIPAGADASQREAVLEEMESIHRRLKAGESFESLADQYSDQKVTLKGGELGTFAFGSLSLQIQDAVRGLSAGDITPVLETEQGAQIFLVDRIEKTPDRPLEEVTPEIENELAQEVIDRHFTEWLENLRTRSIIKVIL